MTPMSGNRTSDSWFLVDLPRVARFSLLVFAVTFLGNPSCLLSTTTEYPVPVASPPFADANTALATPRGGSGVPITRLLRVDDDTEEVTLSADVRADDLGRRLRSRAFINYKLADFPKHYDAIFGGEAIAPSTFDDVRSISASVKNLAILDDGCYQLALVITHEFDEEEFVPISQDDTAILVWWMIKGDPASVDFGQCPGVPPSLDSDAGIEGGT